MFNVTKIVSDIMDGVDELVSIINEKDEEISRLEAVIENLKNEKE